MTSVKSASLGFSAATLIYLIAGGAALTKAVNEDQKAYTLYPGVGYYQFNIFPFNWTQAFEACLSEGGHLAVPNSVAEAEVYKDIISRTNATFQDNVFIGFHDMFVEGDYETVHDYSVVKSGYSQWALGVPNVSPFLSCGGFSKDGGLLNLECYNDPNTAFICEKPLWIDYDFVPNLGYYKLHVDAKTWPEAWQICRNEDSHLAVVNSMDEHQALQEIFAKNPIISEGSTQDHAWVGVHGRFLVNQFRTVVGTSLDKAGYSTWDLGHPALGLVQGDTYVALTRNNGSLSMRPTSFKLAFFCEHEV